ncbi:MAG: RagB/SusD family nutrient uptake outer membrane protein [Thalassobius sp.]|nr:RagB/SusD family nutrient uptake outer membrane protein [Thalassovita sp.]
MKFKYNRSLLYALTTTVLLMFTQCTDLEEEVLDEVLGGESANIESTLAAAYDRLGDGTFVNNTDVLALQEYTTDVALLPTRGSDWGDGGKHREMHEFTWTPSSSNVASSWDKLTNGITRSLTAVKTISESDDAQRDMYLAEAKVLLDFYIYTTLDLYAQAPYRDPLVEDAPLEIRTAPEAIDELIEEVESLLPDLSAFGQNSTHTGRFTREAAYAFLAEMYLNRAVLKDRYNAASAFDFTETSVDGASTDMDKVIEYTSKIIDGGAFQLESNYFHNFDIDNSGASEHIFAIVQKVDYIRNGDNDLGYVHQARNQRPSPNTRGTNASCTTPEFFATWDNNREDPRFSRKYQYSDGTWFMNDGTTGSVPAEDFVPNSDNDVWFHFNRGLLHGQQYGPKLGEDGDFIMTADGRIEVFQLYMEKSAETPMDFTPELDFDNPYETIFAQNEINRGVRIFKFEHDPENGNGSSNVDIPIYRLGGIYTMRAEAYFRKGETTSALNDINALRISRTREELYGSVAGTPINSLDETTLYNEIGFELYWELKDRPKAIRFGRYDEAYTGKAATDPFRRVFPIPQSAIDVTEELTQNYGYDQ